MASNICKSNQNFIEEGVDATPQSEGMSIKSTILPAEDFGSGICDPAYQPQAWKTMGNKLFQQEKFSDIMLVAEGQSVPCHKFLLAAASEYFYNRLVVDTESIDHNLLEVKDINFPTLKVIVSYIYTGHIKITVENAKHLMPALKMFSLKSACDICEQFLMDAVNPGNCIGLYRIGAELNAQLLKVNAEEVMMNNFLEVISYPEFQSMSRDELEEYIQNDNINVPNEDAVFAAVVSWSGANPETRNPDFSRLIQHIRLKYCTSHYLTHEPLMQNLGCHKLVLAAISYKSTDTCSTHQNQAVLYQADHSAPPRRSYRKASTLLVIGGIISPCSPGDMSKKWWYLNKKEWKRMRTTAYPLEVNFYSACVVPGGILVSGGYTGEEITSQCWLLSTANFEWSAVAELNTARWRHASVSVGGQPYVIGGVDGEPTDENLLSSVVISGMFV